jgi:hypothetical protein
MNDSDPKAALRKMGIRNPSRQLVDNYMRVQQAEEWALEVPEMAASAQETQEPGINAKQDDPSAAEAKRPHPSSESALEPRLRETGQLERPRGPRKPGRPRIIASFYPALARVMADQTPLPQALRILGIHLDKRQVRALYRSREFKEMYQEARRQFLSDYGKRSTQQLRKMRRYAGL